MFYKLLALLSQEESLVSLLVVSTFGVLLQTHPEKKKVSESFQPLTSANQPDLD